MDEQPSKLGGYLVERELGRGGMGVVYLARDPRLDRPVAIKSLSEDLGEHPERLARFEREARTLAAMNHPNIAMVYGMEEHLGRQLLVMEYVPGHNLNEHIRRAVRLEPEEAFAICAQIAAGLEAAHELGIVHRDLKPANVRVRSDGVVKVLDFGLAKAEQEVRAVLGDDAATMSMAPTAEGRIMGTAGYMSPEQARGKPVDKRADIWAFGVVLFECLTGQRAFGGETPMDAIVAVLEREPSWELLPERVPARIRELIRRCLEKDAKKRLRDVGDARIDIESILHDRARLDPRRFMTTLGAGPVGVAGLDSERTGTSGTGGTFGSTSQTRLPASLTSFVGRQADLDALRGLLGEARLLTLTGPGGCGKSRLGIECARANGERFGDGAWSVDLASISDPGLVANEVGGVFGLPEAEGRQMEDQLVEALEGREALIVMDNCEHVLAGCASVVSLLLQSCPGVRVIATSREALGVDGEWVYRVGVLSVPEAWSESADVDEISRCESVRLFVDRARAVKQGFVLDRSNARHVVEICRQLDGVPLAIELAAARIKLLGPEQIAERLADRFKLLRSRSGAPRQQTLLAAIEWSFEQLDDSEAAAMRRLSVFKNGATLSAAEGVVALEYGGETEAIEDWEVLDLLGQLVDKSLISVIEPEGDGPAGETRYRMLESIRQYGLSRLDEAGESGVAARAQLDWCARFAKRAEGQLVGRDQRAWFDRLEQEHDNIRAALDFVFERVGEDGEILEQGRVIAAGVWRFWAYAGHIAEGRRLLMRLDRAGAGGDPTPAWARLREGISWIAMMTGDLVQAVAFGRAGLELARLSGDERTVSNLLDCLGAACLGDMLATRAVDYFEESLQIRKSLGDRVLTSVSLCHLAGCHRQLGTLDKARSLYREAMETLRGAGDGLQAAFIHEGVGWLEIASGNAEAAQESFKKAAGLLVPLGALSELPGTVEGFACVAAMRGEDAKAARLFAAAETGRVRLACPARQSEIEEIAGWRSRVESSLDGAALEKSRAEGVAMRLRRAVRHATGDGVETTTTR